ncbi:MAG: oligopeptide/dipeptide ABC transporter ATP-binding protein [Gemmatimonadota bacterium]
MSPAREEEVGRGMAVLEARDVSKVYGARGRGGRRIAAVRDLSLGVREGETLGIVGESGSGKSTTARLMLALEAPTSGTVLYRGSPVREMGGEALRRFRRTAQIVFQDPYGTLNPRLTVATMLREALHVHRIVEGRRAEDDRIGALLEMVGLEARDAGRYAHEFSGGQRQRVGIARALSVEPRILVADEPVSALDVSVQAQILGLLRELQARLGLTLVFIAHDLAVVRQISDRVAVMYMGRVVESAPTDELFREPLHPYTEALLSSIPRVRSGGRGSGRRVLLHGDVGRRSDVEEGGCPFYARCWHPDRGDRCLEAVPGLEVRGGGRAVRCVATRKTSLTRGSAGP